MVRIAVLGPVEVRRDGSLLPVPGGKTAELLVRLALEPGALVRADRLLDDLWAGTATRRNTLQAKVARLRRAIGEPALVLTTDDGYRLAVDPQGVDALRVGDEAAAAAARLAAGDDRAAADLSGAALRRFRGAVLPAAGDWAAPHRARLEAVRDGLTETHLTARLGLGDDVIGELAAAVGAAPYREGLWELLLTALYRAGRQADALAAYRRIAARLDADLGVAPGPRLRELERQILDARRRASAGPARPGTSRRSRASWSGGRRRRPPCRTGSRVTGWSRSPAPAGSARRRSRSRAPGRCPRSPAGSGSCASRSRGRRTTCSMP